jgi:hypothetical protein
MCSQKGERCPISDQAQVPPGRVPPGLGRPGWSGPPKDDYWAGCLTGRPNPTGFGPPFWWNFKIRPGPSWPKLGSPSGWCSPGRGGGPGAWSGLRSDFLSIQSLGDLKPAGRPQIPQKPAKQAAQLANGLGVGCWIPECGPARPAQWCWGPRPPDHHC